MNNVIELNKLMKLIEQNSAISFDIFDTLVLRNVIEPTDIFKIIENEYIKKYGNEDLLNIDFYKLRIECEHSVRIKNSYREDIHFAEIYNELEKYLDKKIVSRLQALELSIEEKFIVKNPVMFEAFQYALSLNKKVFLISDMYLPVQFIQSILNNLKIINYTELYVSCDLMKTKHYGTIYSYVKNQQQINPKNWLHIGDNYHSDVQQALKNNINIYHYKKVSERANIMPKAILDINNSILTAIEINNIYTTLSKNEYWFNFGRNVVGRLFLGLSTWLIDHVKGKTGTIHFLARDGYIIKKIYDLLTLNIKENVPSSNYLYASRRAFQFIDTLDESSDYLVYILSGYNPQFDQKLTCNEILSNLFLNTSKYETQLKKYNLTLSTILSTENDTLKQAQLFLKEIMPDIQKQLLKEKETLIDYLTQQKLLNNNENTYIFDIGWRGSIQKSLAKLTKKEIIGFYLGTNPFCYPEIKNNTFGYLFQNGIPEEKNSFVTHFLMIFEFLFTAPHGSLIHFERQQNNEIHPILSNVENDSSIYSLISLMQEGVIDYISYTKNYAPYLSTITPDLSLTNIHFFLEEEKYIDLKNFSKLMNSVGFGNSKDIKPYVSIIKEEDYLNNPTKIHENSKHNLWPNALLIKQYDRFFTNKEFNRLIHYSNNTQQVPTYVGHGDLEYIFIKKLYQFYKKNGVFITLKRAVSTLIHMFKYKFRG